MKSDDGKCQICGANIKSKSRIAEDVQVYHRGVLLKLCERCLQQENAHAMLLEDRRIDQNRWFCTALEKVGSDGHAIACAYGEADTEAEARTIAEDEARERGSDPRNWDFRTYPPQQN
jgi:hypothetical protein